MEVQSPGSVAKEPMFTKTMSLFDSEVVVSDFSFDPSGSSKSPSFKKLVSGSISDSAKAESLTENRDKAAVRLSALEAAVTSISDSTKNLNRIMGDADDVAAVNSEAAQVQVLDVDNASKLADELSLSIKQNREIAKQAQAVALEPSQVQRALR